MSHIIPKTYTGSGITQRPGEFVNDNGVPAFAGNLFARREHFIRNGYFQTNMTDITGSVTIVGTDRKQCTDGWYLSVANMVTSRARRYAHQTTDVYAPFFVEIEYSADTSKGTTFVALEQTQYDVARFAGKTLAYSFYAKANTPYTLQIEVKYAYNDANSSTEESILIPVMVDIGTSWEKHDVRIAIPEVHPSKLTKMTKMTLRHFIHSKGTRPFNQGPDNNIVHFANFDDGSPWAYTDTTEQEVQVGKYYENTTTAIPLSVNNTGVIRGFIPFVFPKAYPPAASQITVNKSATVATLSISSVTKYGFQVTGTTVNNENTVALVYGFVVEIGYT